MEVNKKYGVYALQLYLYLAKNANDYEMALSQAAEAEAGIKKTTFHKYLNLFIQEATWSSEMATPTIFTKYPASKRKKKRSVRRVTNTVHSSKRLKKSAPSNPAVR